MQNSERRRFLRSFVSVGALFMAFRTPLAVANKVRWKNWSKAQQSAPSWQIYPRSAGELQRALKSAPAPIRAVGAGQSFSDICVSSGTHVLSDELQGMVSWNDDTQRARFKAGTPIVELGRLLQEVGQALPVQPDATQASIAGAIATATHGCGGRYSSLSSMVTAAELVTVDGDRLQIDNNQNSSLLPAVSCSLGALGFTTEVELQNQTQFRLEERLEVESLSETLSNWNALDARNRHFEALVFLESERCVRRSLNETTARATNPEDERLQWGSIFSGLVQLGHGVPPLDGTLQKILSFAQPESVRVAPSAELFSYAMPTRYNALEYSIPQQNGVEALLELLHTARRADMNVMLPIQLRSVAADTQWISPQYRQPSFTINLRQWVGADHQALFALAEPIFRRHGGRPHWATMHSCSAQDFAQMYPRWDDFLRLRRELDPKGRLLSAPLKRLFVDH